MKLTLPALQPGTQYRIQIRTDDGEAVSNWSPEFTFSTDIDSRTPGVPANRTWVSSGDSFVGRWDEVSTYTNGEAAYILAYEVELNAGATTKIVSVPNKTDGTQIEFILSYEQNRALFTNPQPVVNFRVRAVDNKGLRGAWSAQIPASNPVPAAPTAAVATNVIDGVDLKWTAPGDADLIGYNVYVGTTAGFTPSAGNRVFSGSATQFHYASTTYSLQYFKIRAVDKFNQESTDLTAQGTPQSPFTVDTTPPAVPTGLGATIVNNANGIGAVATVTWTMTSPPSDLAGFNIRWRKTGTTDWSVTTTDSDSRVAIVELGSAYQDYDFQIRAFDFSANESAWSATALGDSPANAAPAQVTGVSVTPGKDNLTIAWNANTEGDLDDYEVQVATNNTFTTGLLTYRVGATTLAVNGLAVATTYYVRVRAKDTGGLYGTYSATASATTGDYPGANPSDGEIPAVPGAATLVAGIGYVYASWNPVTLNAVGGPQNDTVTYEVHTATSAGGTYTKALETSSTFAVLENLTYGTTYYVKLIAKDRDGASALSVASSGASPAKVVAADSNLTAGDVGAATPAYVDQAETDAIATSGTNADTKISNYDTTTVQPALNGKNKIHHSTSTPGTTANIAGDTWIQYNGSNQIIGQWRGTGGTSWVAETINNAFIANLDAAKINTGTLSADRIGANSIISSKLLISDLTNLLDNPEFRSGSNTGWASNPTIVTDTLPDGGSGPVAQVTGNGAIQDFTNRAIPVKAGDKFYGEAWVRIKTAGTDLDGTLQWATTFAPNSGAVNWPSFGTVNVSTLTVGVWHKISGTITIGSVGGTLTPRFSVRNDLADGVYQFYGMTIRRMSGGELIIDGSVKANALATGTLAAATMTLGSGGVIQSSDYVAGSAGFKLSTDGLEIREGTIVANAIISGTGIVNNLIINSGGAIQSSNYVANTTGFKIDNSGINIGSNGYVNAGSLKAGTITGTTINVGAGGVLNVDSTAKVKSNNYVAGSTGWQLDSAGLEINDGAVKADALVSGTIDTATLTLSGANGKIVGTGFELSGSGLNVTSGTIEAAAVKIQSGENLVPAHYSDFEFANAASAAGLFTQSNLLWDINSVSQFNDKSLGTTWGTAPANPYVYFGSSTTDYNIPVDVSTTYIGSAYVSCRGTVATNVQMKIKFSNGTIATLANVNLSANMTGWQRISGVVQTAASGITGAVIFFESSTLTNGAGFNVDGVQLERQLAGLTTPSPWKPSGLTTIHGGLIRTGEIRSTANSQTWDGTQYVEDTNRPAWHIDPEGDASFNRMNVRGRLVIGDLTAAQAETGDPFGYAYTIASANYVPGEQGWMIRGDGWGEFRNLASDSINGEVIQVGTLTADRIATGLLDAQVAIVGDVYAEGDDGERVGINKEGFYVYGPKPDPTLPEMGPLYVSFPTDGEKPNIITGELQANTLLATGGISVRGLSEFAAGAEIKMFNDIAESKSAPTLSANWETAQFYGNEWDTEMTTAVNMWWRSDITPNLTGDAYFDEGFEGWESNTLIGTHTPAAIQYNATQNYVELQFPTAATPSNFGTWIKTVPGQSYTITASVWVYTGNQAVKVGVAFGTSGSANTVFDGWTTITHTFTASSNEHYVMVMTDGNATGGQAFVDHVFVPQHQAGAWEVAFKTPIDEVTDEMHFRIFTKEGRWAGRPPSGEGWNSVNYNGGYYVGATRWIDAAGQQYKARMYRSNTSGNYTLVCWKDTATGSLYSVSYIKITGQNDIEEPRLGVIGRPVSEGGSGQELVVWERHVANKRYQGSVRNTDMTHKRWVYLPDDTAGTSHGVVGGIVHHPGDFGSDRFIVLSRYSSGTSIYGYTGSGGSGTTTFTGTRSRNDDFPRPTNTPASIAWKPDAAAPGGTGYYYTVSNRGVLYKHEGGGNKWTTETNKWWVGFTWYDNVQDKTVVVNTTSGSATITATSGTFASTDVGRGIISDSTAIPAGAKIDAFINSTTVNISANATATVTGTNVYVGRHETKISARSSIMMTKRARLNVTVPTFPPSDGTGDVVNKARIYLARSSAATAPANASDYNYNTEIATTSGSVVNASFSNARKPPVTGNFPSGNPAQIISSTGNSFWKANDQAQFQNLVLVGTSDANTAAGNTPALRIGNPTGAHMRIDSNEIITMAGDTGQAALYLNQAGATVVANSGGTFRVGSDGTTITAIKCGSGGYSINGSGIMSIPHNAGTSTHQIVAWPASHYGSPTVCIVETKGTNSTTFEVRNSSTAALITSQTRTFNWILIAT